MKFSKFVNGACITALALTSLNTLAADITIGGDDVSIIDTGVHRSNGTVADATTGRGDASGGNKYEITGMSVGWSDSDQITVDVFTDFGNYNNDYDYGPGDNFNIIFGDLFITTTDGTNTSKFVFSLGDILSDVDQADGFETNYTATNARYYDFNNNSQENQWQSEGGLYSYDPSDSANSITVNEYHGVTSSGSSVVFADNLGSELTDSNGQWKIDNNSYRNGQSDILTFTFNVGSISAFKTASQLSLEWAMSCFNDNIQGTFNVAGNTVTSVSEPSTLALFGLTIAGIAYRRRKSS